MSGVQTGGNGKNIPEWRKSMCEEVKIQGVFDKAACAGRKSMEIQTCV